VRRALLDWVALAAWMLVIFAASSRPRVPFQEDVPDWISHPLAYLVLAVLAARAFTGAAHLDLLPAAGVLAFCVAYGVSDEWHQSFVPGRHADPWDVVKDGIGGLGGLAAYQARSRRDGPREARPS
jgi:VanZ family protein